MTIHADNFLDDLLRLPRKIDFINYAPYAGGDFFTSLILLSHSKTKNLIYFVNNHPNTENISQSDYNGFKVKQYNNRIIFSKPNYYSMNYLIPTSRLVEYFRPNEIIDLYKHSIANAFLPSYFDSLPARKNKITLYKDSIILIPNHWIMSPKKMEIFSQYKYWDVINLNPESKKGKKFLYKTRDQIKSVKEAFVGHFLNRFPFLENFPFLDYILEEDYETIKYWIENRYGSDLDFDFIDKSLPMWKKVRVDPYL